MTNYHLTFNINEQYINRENLKTLTTFAVFPLSDHIFIFLLIFLYDPSCPTEAHGLICSRLFQLNQINNLEF